MSDKFYKKSPCNDCPYRRDAPLQLWHRCEFEKLLEQELDDPIKKDLNSQGAGLAANVSFGRIFNCHKGDNHICVGWLMKQLDGPVQNLNLRMLLSRENVSSDYLDSLHCKSPLYETLLDMVKANYPELVEKYLPEKNKKKTIVCKANELTEFLNSDLDNAIHEGFTVGTRGKVMYWYFIWHGNTTGNASIYTSGYPMKRAYIKGDQIITIHFK